MRLVEHKNTRLGLWERCSTPPVIMEKANCRFNIFYARHREYITGQKVRYCSCDGNQCKRYIVATKHAVSKLCAVSIEEQIRILEAWGIVTATEPEEAIIAPPHDHVFELLWHELTNKSWFQCRLCGLCEMPKLNPNFNEESWK